MIPPQLGEIYLFLIVLSGQDDTASNFTIVCTFFYAVIDCLNRDCVLADSPIQKFLNWLKLHANYKNVYVT